MFEVIYGVDFSGARLAGRNTWVARLEVAGGHLRVRELRSLERMSGTAERERALGHLVAMIAASERALWGLDFPFGLPIEVMPAGTPWAGQLAWLRAWGDDGYALGVECLRRARALGGPGHIRRATDTETRAPFDPYHYRIIYQTFFGMRDVLGPLAGLRRTAILPFQYRKLPRALRVVAEACPSSTLKRLGLPHHNYKQTEAGPLTAARLRTRRAILAGVAADVTVTPWQRRVMMRNGGGDALDAVLAGLGAWQAWRQADHRAIRRHPRYGREGRLFV